jgi:hypothetical protein
MRIRALWTVTCLATAPAGLAAQASPGSELWRVAAVTLPVPAVLAAGSVATFWNPAQESVPHGHVGLDLIQTPAALGATGIIAAVRLPAAPLGDIGLVYARMGLAGLVRTSDSPDPDGSSIPFYAQELGLTWSRDVVGTRVGATLAYHDTRLDGTTSDRWSLDVGVLRTLGTRLQIAFATRGLRRLGSDPAQDIGLAVNYHLWRGVLWGNTPGILAARYGMIFGHPGGVDHQLGAGLDIGKPVAVDVVVSREASYGNVAWRGAAGVRVAVGHYRIEFARDGGVADLGSAFRVGLEAALR